MPCMLVFNYLGRFWHFSPFLTFQRLLHAKFYHTGVGVGCGSPNRKFNIISIYKRSRDLWAGPRSVNCSNFGNCSMDSTVMGVYPKGCVFPKFSVPCPLAEKLYVIYKHISEMQKWYKPFLLPCQARWGLDFVCHWERQKVWRFPVFCLLRFSK